MRIADMTWMQAVEAAEPLRIPVFPYGITPYFMDYPGTVTVSPTTYERRRLEILGSMRRHGFKRIDVVNGHGGNTSVRPAVEAWAARRKGVALRWHDWWKASESFPWTRVEGAGAPAGRKPRTPSLAGDELSPQRFREVMGDSSMGGYYERSADETDQLWAFAVEETREMLAAGW